MKYESFQFVFVAILFGSKNTIFDLHLNRQYEAPCNFSASIYFHILLSAG
jgi:hypothetical protein